MRLCLFRCPQWGKQKTNQTKPSGGAPMCHVFHVEIFPNTGAPNLHIAFNIQALGHPYFEASPNTPAQVWVCNCEQPQTTWFGKIQRHFTVQIQISHVL